MNSTETLFQNPTSFEILQLSQCETVGECPNEPARHAKLSDPDGFNYVVREKDLRGKCLQAPMMWMSALGWGGAGGAGDCGCPVSNTLVSFGQGAEIVSPCTILTLSPFIIEGNGKAVSAGG